jgi:hypothetical protein
MLVRCHELYSFLNMERLMFLVSNSRELNPLFNVSVAENIDLTLF